MFKQFIFCLFLVLCEANEEIGICKKNITVTSLHVVTEQIPVTELVMETCTKIEDEYEYSEYGHYGYEYPAEPRTKTYMCPKIKEVMRSVTKYEQKQVNETHKFCCMGYVQANLTFTTTNEPDFRCVPLCDPPCKNGYCSAPERCTLYCMPGFTPNFDETVSCSPVCDLDCGHGTCVDPNKCRCDFGYELTNSTSHAVCTKLIFECPYGFKEYNGSCEPECPDGCLHGVCIAPGVCQCDPGYQLQDYRILVDRRFQKVCEPECNPGYTKKDGVCRPECKQSCGRGTCVKPNICECFQGYKIDLKQFSSQDNLNAPLCVPLCKNYCPGECVAPNTCVTPPLLSPFTTPASTTSTKSTTTIIPTGISSIPTIIPTAISSISTKIPKIKSTLTTDPITSRRATTIPNIKSTTESGITTTRKQSVIKITTTTPYAPLNNDKNKLSTVATQFYKSTRDKYETSSSTIKYKYQNENKTYKELGHTVTKNNTPTTTETGRGNGAKTWLEQHWVSVLLPIIIVLLAAVVMLAVWRRAPIIIFLRGRSYAVEDDVPDDQDPQFQYSKKKDKVVCKGEDL